MRYINLHLLDAVPSILVKPADRLPIEFRSYKRRIPQWDNCSLNFVVQRIILNRRFLIHVAGLKTIDNRNDLHQKAETAIKQAR